MWSGACRGSCRSLRALGWRLLVVVAALYVIGDVASYLAAVVIPVAVALLLAALLSPAVHRLQSGGVPRGARDRAGHGRRARRCSAVCSPSSSSPSSAVSRRSRPSSRPASTTIVGLADRPGRCNSAPPSSPVCRPRSSPPSARTRRPSPRVRSPPPRPSARPSPRPCWCCSCCIFFLHGGPGIWQFLLGVVPGDVRTRVDIAGRTRDRSTRQLCPRHGRRRRRRRRRHRDRAARARRPPGRPPGRTGVPRRVRAQSSVALLAGGAAVRRRTGRPNGPVTGPHRARHHHRYHAARGPRPAAAPARDGPSSCTRSPSCSSIAAGLVDRRHRRSAVRGARCSPCSTPASARCSARPMNTSTPTTCTPARRRNPAPTSPDSTASPNSSRPIRTSADGGDRVRGEG